MKSTPSNSSSNTSSGAKAELVSIVMPAFNAAPYLKSAVASVISQTYSNWELLIVDDASTDETLHIARQLESQDSRIRVLTKEKNSGVAETRNLALKAASGRYIAFLDSDDLWVPEKLKVQVQFMKEHGVLICFSAYQRIDETGSKLGTVRPPAKLDYRALLRSNFIGNLTGIYDCEALGRQYFTQFKHEDYVAWLGLIKKAGLAKSINQELGMYRVYAGSTSSNKLKTMTWQWRIYRESESLGFFHSLLLMFCYAYHATRKRV